MGCRPPRRFGLKMTYVTATISRKVNMSCHHLQLPLPLMSDLQFLVENIRITDESCPNLYNDCGDVQEGDYLVTIRFDKMMQNAQNWGIADKSTCVLCGELDRQFVAEEFICYDFKKCKISTLSVCVCTCYQKEQYSAPLIKTADTDMNGKGYDVSPAVADVQAILGFAADSTPTTIRYFHRFMYWSSDYFKHLYALVVRKVPAYNHKRDVSIKFYSRAYLAPPSIKNYVCANDFTILCIVKNKWSDIHWLNPRVAMMHHLIGLCSELVTSTTNSITPGSCLKKRSDLVGGRLENPSVKRARQVLEEQEVVSQEY